MDFSSAKAKHQKLHTQQEDDSPAAQRRIAASRKLAQSVPTDMERTAFFEGLAKCGSKPVVLSLVPSLNKEFVPKTFDHLPKPLTSLYKDEYTKLNFVDLLTQCHELSFISLTEEECQAIERDTREQSKSGAWFKQRAGRITASRLRAVCRTNPASPAKSLIKVICYPEAHKFTTEATRCVISVFNYVVHARGLGMNKVIWYLLYFQVGM